MSWKMQIKGVKEKEIYQEMYRVSFLLRKALPTFVTWLVHLVGNK